MRATEKVCTRKAISSLNDYTFYKRSGFWVTKANTIFVTTAALTAVIINRNNNERTENLKSKKEFTIRLLTITYPFKMFLQPMYLVVDVCFLFYLPPKLSGLLPTNFFKYNNVVVRDDQDSRFKFSNKTLKRPEQRSALYALPS